MPVYMPDISQHLYVKTPNIVAHHVIVHTRFRRSEQRQEIETRELCRHQ